MLRARTLLLAVAVLVLPSPAQAISIVLTAPGGDPLTEGLTTVSVGEPTAAELDFWIDISGTPGSTPGQAYADPMTFSSLVAYQFVVDAGSGVTFTPGPSGFGFSSQDNGSGGAFWASQLVSGADRVVSWNDQLFETDPAGGVPLNSGSGGFATGLIQLGTLTFDYQPTPGLNPILVFRDAGNTLVDGGTQGILFPGAELLLVQLPEGTAGPALPGTPIPEPAAALLVVVGCVATTLARRHAR